MEGGGGHVRHHPECHPDRTVIGAGELLGEDHREQVIGPLAAVGGVVLQAQHPEGAHLGEHLVEGNPLVLLPLGNPRIDLLLHEGAHHPAELVVLVGEWHVLSCSVRIGRRPAWSRTSMRSNWRWTTAVWAHWKPARNKTNPYTTDPAATKVSAGASPK
jgi:hypothetical protein